MKRVLKRCLWLMCLSYALCSILDYKFFDYEFPFICFKQTVCLLMMFALLLACAAAGYIGYAILFVFIFISGILAYAYHVFGYRISYSAIASLFGTNLEELSLFVSFGSVAMLVAVVVLTLGIVVLLRKLIPFRTLTVRSIVLILSLAGMYAVRRVPFFYYGHLEKQIDRRDPNAHLVHEIPCSKTQKQDPELNGMAHFDFATLDFLVPYSDIQLAAKYINTYFSRSQEFAKSENFPSTDNGDDDLTVVLVIGESVRADHCSFNGYGKPTTEDLDAFSPAIIPFPRFRAFSSFTHASAMSILCGLTKGGQALEHTSFVGILKKHGYTTSLVVENTAANVFENREGYPVAGYAFARIKNLKMPILQVADEVVKAGSQEGRQLIVIENGTGHFPYHTEQDLRQFKPDQGDFRKTPERFINDYDNCVYSINRFLARIMDGLKGKNAVVLYCSDHGQMLGERGHWYAHNCEESWQVGAFIWFSEEYEKRHPEYVRAIRAAADEYHIHGQVFATILSLVGIKSEVPLKVGDLTEGIPEEKITEIYSSME